MTRAEDLQLSVPLQGSENTIVFFAFTVALKESGVKKIESCLDSDTNPLRCNLLAVSAII